MTEQLPAASTAPTSEDLERGWRLVELGPDRRAYQCMRDGGDGPCAQNFDSRRALGSHQGRGHTAKAKRAGEGVSVEALATSIGKAIMRGEPIPQYLKRAILLRVAETSERIAKLATNSEDGVIAKAARENASLARLILGTEPER